MVTNTGTRQQLVSVRILDQSGAFISTLLPDLQVPPESVVVKGVSAILEKKSTAIELSAAGPVTGALVSEQVAGPLDFAVAGVSRAADLARPWCQLQRHDDDAELRDVAARRAQRVEVVG